MVFKSKHYKKSKRSMSRKNKKNSKKLSKRNTKINTKRTRKTQKKLTKRMKGGFGEVAGCDYMKVEGMKLPGLAIEDKIAFVDSSCKTTTPTLAAGNHPNLFT
jgi:hypothetical protein